MKQLIKFEWKKIITKKLNLIAMAAGIFLAVLCSVTWVFQSYYSETIEEEEITGIEAIKKETEHNNQLTDLLTDDYVRNILREYQEAEKQLTNPDLEGYDFALIMPKSSVYAVIASNYTDSTQDWWSWEVLKKIDTENGLSFYEQRQAKIEATLNAEYSYGNYTEIEKDYWRDKEADVTTPFKWGSKEVWGFLWDAVGVLFYQMFVLVVCVSPVFSGEYTSGADALLLTTKYGKNRLLAAKMIATISFCLTYMLVAGGIGFGVLVFLIGMKGGDVPVQLWGSVIPYDWSVAQAVGVNALLMILLGVAIGAFTMMLSARMKSSFVTLLINMCLLMGSAFIPFSKSSRIFNQILYLTPIRCFNLQETLDIFNSYQIGNVVISFLGMTVIVYVILTIFSLAFTINGFRKHQIGGR